MTVWMFLTRWGNSLLLLPTASWIGVSLWAVGERPVAWRWVIYFGIALGLVLATKIAFLGWGIGSRALDFTGISGHSTLAAAVLPMLAWWLTQERPRATQLRAVVGASLFAIVVGVSRILLSAHSPSEVVAGLALGLAVSWLAIPHGTVSVRNLAHLRWFVLFVLIAVGSLSRVGESGEAHGIVVQIALALSGRSEPFQRNML
jgi:membrane-associated phospholipid phosphatase